MLATLVVLCVATPDPISISVAFKKLWLFGLYLVHLCSTEKKIVNAHLRSVQITTRPYSQLPKVQSGVAIFN